MEKFKIIYMNKKIIIGIIWFIVLIEVIFSCIVFIKLIEFDIITKGWLLLLEVFLLIVFCGLEACLLIVFSGFSIKIIFGSDKNVINLKN